MKKYGTFKAYLEDKVELQVFPYIAPVPELRWKFPEMVEEFEIKRVKEKRIHAQTIEREAVNYFNGCLDEGCSIFDDSGNSPRTYFSSSNKLRYLVCITPSDSSICVGVQDLHLYSSPREFY